tara:strand:+ start:5760 stop:6128 length:369 start_codon:yes stop_codon:yes gene_type:complete
MEAWLKFQAEGVTQIIGLNIGKLIFFALNKVELLFLITLGVLILPKRRAMGRENLVNIYGLLTVILLIQTFYLLPALDQRVDMIINGTPPVTSFFHFYYLFLEVIKVITLFIFSQLALKKIT